MFQINLEPYLNNATQCYEDILTINKMPTDELKKYCFIERFSNISPFTSEKPSCRIIIKHLPTLEPMNRDDIATFLSIISDLNYTIDHRTTRLLQNNIKHLLFFITK